MPAKWTRRGFLGAIATATVSACVLSKLDTGWLPEPVRRYAACERLRKAWLDHARAQGAPPTHMYVGRALYEAYEGELIVNMRYCGTAGAEDRDPRVLFKGVRLDRLSEIAPGDEWRVVTTGHTWQTVFSRAS